MFNRSKQFLVSIVGVLVLTAALGASIAHADVRDNSGPVKDGETRADPDQCANYKDWYDKDLAAKDQKGADYDKNLAAGRGCKWAQTRIAPDPTGPWSGDHDVQYASMDPGSGGGGGATGEQPPAEGAGNEMVETGDQAGDAGSQPEAEPQSQSQPRKPAKHKKHLRHHRKHRRHAHA